MKIFDDIDALSKIIKASVVVIGNFDGVHLGHQKLFQLAKEVATREDIPLIAVTFNPHPYKILNKVPSFEFKSILTHHDKVNLLLKNNIDYLLLQKFDIEFSKIESKSFLEDFLIDKLKTKHIIVGENFRFGWDKADVRLLEKYSKDYSFGFWPIKLLSKEKDTIISSSQIRDQLEKGNIDKVSSMLGRDYIITSTIMEVRNKIALISLKEKLALRFGLYDALLKEADNNDNKEIEIIFSYHSYDKAELYYLFCKEIKEGTKIAITLKTRKTNSYLEPIILNNN